MKLIIDIPFEAYYTFKCDLGKGNLNALAEIVANGIPYEERPQGKWKNISMGITYKYQCSLCGRTISTTPMFLADYPYIPKGEVTEDE